MGSALDEILAAFATLVDAQPPEPEPVVASAGNFRCDGCVGCQDCRFCTQCDNCNDCTYCHACNDSLSLTQCRYCDACETLTQSDLCGECSGSSYLTLCLDCEDCVQCFGCVGLVGAEFHILNEKVPRKDYFKRVKALRAELDAKVREGWRPPWGEDPEAESDAPESDAPESDAPESDAPESDAPESESDAPESDAPESDDFEPHDSEHGESESDEPKPHDSEPRDSEPHAPQPHAPESGVVHDAPPDVAAVAEPGQPVPDRVFRDPSGPVRVAPLPEADPRPRDPASAVLPEIPLWGDDALGVGDVPMPNSGGSPGLSHDDLSWLDADQADEDPARIRSRAEPMVPLSSLGNEPEGDPSAREPAPAEPKRESWENLLAGGGMDPEEAKPSLTRGARPTRRTAVGIASVSPGDARPSSLRRARRPTRR